MQCQSTLSFEIKGFQHHYFNHRQREQMARQTQIYNTIYTLINRANETLLHK
jgi:hypothetical protein